VNKTNPKGKPLFQRGDETTVTFAPEVVGIVAEWLASTEFAGWFPDQ
jgi:hypothetical protein